MPLRAQVGGVWVNAGLLCDAEWQALKRSRSLRMPCCDARGHARTSRLGTRHFVHSPGSHCGGEGESPEHLAAKAEIVRACHEVGWDVQSEFAGDKWRADVYATRGRHRVAFEVQWSPQTLEVTRERQAAYGTDVKCCWLFNEIPLPMGRRWNGNEPGLPTERDLPMFDLSLSAAGFTVKIDCVTMDLRDFVQARLERRIRFCEQRHYALARVEVVVHSSPCLNCGSQYDVLHTRRILRSYCGAQLVETDPGDIVSSEDDPHSARRNWRVVQSLFPSEAKQLRVSIKRRFSSVIKRSYWCFGCPECDWFLGNHFFTETMMMEADGESPFCSKDVPHSERQSDSHWCFSRNSSFCA